MQYVSVAICMLVYHACVICLTGDIHKHLYSMCGLLRPSDNIRLVSFIFYVACLFLRIKSYFLVIMM